MCMYACMYIQLKTKGMYIHTHICMHVCMYVSVCVSMHVKPNLYNHQQPVMALVSIQNC